MDQESVVKYIYISFILIWILIITISKFSYKNGFFVFVIPIILFVLAFFNGENICNDDIVKDNFAITFANIGIIVSLSFLTSIKEKEIKNNKDINRAIFLAMVFVLLTFYHIWVPLEYRIVFKHVRSCLETIAITLYIYALICFFTSFSCF